MPVSKQAERSRVTAGGQGLCCGRTSSLSVAGLEPSHSAASCQACLPCCHRCSSQGGRKARLGRPAPALLRGASTARTACTARPTHRQQLGVGGAAHKPEQLLSNPCSKKKYRNVACTHHSNACVCALKQGARAKGAPARHAATLPLVRLPTRPNLDPPSCPSCPLPASSSASPFSHRPPCRQHPRPPAQITHRARTRAWW